MNVFFLDKNPHDAARFHCDKHVVKMIVETAQLLSTAHRVLDGKQVSYISNTDRKAKRWQLEGGLDQELYKATHANHPSAVWVRKNKATYEWTYHLFVNLLQEYNDRYKKIHSTARLMYSLGRYPKNMKNDTFVDPPLAMPDHCKVSDAVESYRNYYRIEKRKFATWKNGNIPEWFDK